VGKDLEPGAVQGRSGLGGQGDRPRATVEVGKHLRPGDRTDQPILGTYRLNSATASLQFETQNDWDNFEYLRKWPRRADVKEIDLNRQKLVIMN
jgi:hypothetical protein